MLKGTLLFDPASPHILADQGGKAGQLRQVFEVWV